jgi:hypothetical protein
MLEAALTQLRSTRPSDLCGRPRRGPNFQLFLNRQLRPLLALPKEEFAILFITSPLTNYLVAVGAPAAQKLGRRSRQTRFHLGRFALSAS